MQITLMLVILRPARAEQKLTRSLARSQEVIH